MKREQAISLPDPLYWSLPELCERWGCHSDRPFLYMNSGLLVPSALVPKYLLPLPVHEGIAPNVCVVLDNYREIAWGHDAGETVTLIAGQFTCVYPLGDGWQTLQLSIDEPLLINRRDLVVLDAEREVIEESFAATRPKRGNGAERQSANLLIRALTMAAYPEDQRPYYVAKKVCASVWLADSTISVETVAKKIKAAFALDRGSQEALGAV